MYECGVEWQSPADKSYELIDCISRMKSLSVLLFEETVELELIKGEGQSIKEPVTAVGGE